MEISHASIETQSAAVGINGKAEEVTVSTDAEFMMMIAHGIYSNKALALVRELLCNARDGQTKAGTLDQPIVVTLTDNKLVVLDKGTGIPNNIFASTYLTFGKSTKRQDKTATGGFGVGTKVPWAVCDTFSVRNFIEGTMTAYSVMKSDPAMDGKPTCTPIMTVPSTEHSGVEVSVPFPEKMHNDIRRCIENFASELNIPVILNELRINNDSGFNHVELRNHGFTILPQHPKTVIQQSPFYVRQGDVLYPIERQEEFADAFDLMVHLNPNSHSHPILFQAEPDSIIPTLSRESLQYTDRTSSSIRKLMANAMKMLADNMDEMALAIYDGLPEICAQQPGFVQEIWSNRHKAYNILERNKRMFHQPRVSSSGHEMMINNVQRWLMGNTPYLETQQTKGRAFRDEFSGKLETLFLKELDRFPYLDKAKLLELRHFGTGHQKINGSEVHKKMVDHMYKELIRFRDIGRLDKNIVDTYFANTDNISYAARSSSSASAYFTELTKICEKIDEQKEKVCAEYKHNHIRQMLYVSNTVIISSNPKTMMQRAQEYLRGKPDEDKNPLIPNWGFGRVHGARIIRLRAGAKDSDVAAIVQRFKALGYDVITLLTPTKEEQKELADLAAERARLKEIPLPQLGNLIHDNIPSWPTNERVKSQKLLKSLNKNPAFKGKPHYIILGKGKELPSGMSCVSDYRKLTKLVGTDIVCVSTKPEIAKVIKEGRINAEDTVVAFAKGFLSRKDIRRKLLFRNTFLVKRTRQNKYLTKYLFPVDVPILTEQERSIFDDFVSMSRVFKDLGTLIHEKTRRFQRPNRVVRHFTQLFDRYEVSHFCDVNRALDAAYARRPSQTRTLAREIMRSILK